MAVSASAPAPTADQAAFSQIASSGEGKYGKDGKIGITEFKNSLPPHISDQDAKAMFNDNRGSDYTLNSDEYAELLASDKYAELTGSDEPDFVDAYDASTGKNIKVPTDGYGSKTDDSAADRTDKSETVSDVSNEARDGTDLQNELNG